MPDPARPSFPWSAAHFVGVGGHSMSGLASALCRLGVPVSGSDLAASARTERAAAAGVRVRIGHDPATVAGLPDRTAVVFNTDVPIDNPELAAARERGLEVVHRSVVLDWFLRAGSAAIAVTGTHGKTTTTSLVGLALLGGGLDPTIFVGADVPYLEGGNHRLGLAGPVVAEVDESDGSFVRYQPDVAVVTNVEPEHLEHYGGSFDRVRAAYRQFLGNVRPGGGAVICADDSDLRRLVPDGVDVLWYGLGGGADLTAVDMVLGAESAFTLRLRGRELARVNLGIPGKHNVANALAALGVAWRLGLDLQASAVALEGFGGAGRRFEVLARARGVTVVDDYAHNPTKVAATLAAARLLRPSRLFAVFQPHRYQRTQHLWDGFAGAFTDADHVILTDIYAPAGEAPLPGVSSAALAQSIEAASRVPVRHIPERDAVAPFCAAVARPGDFFLVMGAGDVTLAARALAQRLSVDGEDSALPRAGIRRVADPTR